MKKIYTLILTGLLAAMAANAQGPYGGMITYDAPRSEKVGDKVVIYTTVNADMLDLHTQQMIVFTPVLTSQDGTRTHEFDTYLVVGKKRLKMLRRQLAFGDYYFQKEPKVVMVRKNKTQQAIPLVLEVPYESWIREGRFVVREEMSGCSNIELDRRSHTLITEVLPPLFEPTYDLVYVTPPVEPVKQRSESHTARLNYRVGKYDLLRDFGNNAVVLDEVHKIVSEIRNDENLSITELTITGYASPDGNYQSNMVLSENRARSFASFLRDRYGLSQSQMKIDWKGEDWPGLRKVVEESYIPDKNEVLSIIDGVYDVNQRKARLRRLSNGHTYRLLLEDYFPALRRNDYTIAYVARPFSVEEAKGLIRTKPQHLSLNEMFLVANTYSKDSKEFKEVFDIATRLYPEDVVARMNSATLEIELGAYDAAINHLEGIEMPEAWNNLGVAYIHKQEYDRAAEYFRRAAAMGSAVAAQNAENLANWQKER